MYVENCIPIAEFYTEASGDRVRLEMDGDTGELELYTIEHQILFNEADVVKLQQALERAKLERDRISASSEGTPALPSSRPRR